MPIVGIVIGMFAITMGVHAARRGRYMPWLCFIIFVPVVGGLVYFFTYVWPELAAGSGRASSRAAPSLSQLEAAFAKLDTAHTREALARGYLGAGRSAEAVEVCRGGLVGPYSDDPALTLLLAAALLEVGHSSEARQHLDLLADKSPGYEPEQRESLRSRVSE